MKASRIITALAVLLLYSIFAGAVFASVSDDQVTSQKIKEADGTSGQNTNSGSGVKTGHIQDGAVTTGKIADSAVTTTKIQDGAVTANKVADSSVTTNKLVDGSVNDAKITGPISASKISSTGLNADTVDGKHASDLAPAVHPHPTSQVTGLDAALAGKSDVTHNHDSLYQKKYSNVIVVAKSGGDFSDPLAAINSITDASDSNPYVIKIMPGIYEIPWAAFSGKSYVDIEGSGRDVTKITSHSQGMGGPGTLNYFNVVNSELRDITVECIGPSACGYYAYAIQIVGGGNPTFTNVNANAYYAGDTAGFFIQQGGLATLKNVNAYATGCHGQPNCGCLSKASGIEVFLNSTVYLDSSAVGASDGYYTGSFYMFGANTVVKGAGLRLGQPALNSGGTFKCVNCYDNDFNAIPNQ